jgi:hypothetical protein
MTVSGRPPGSRGRKPQGSSSISTPLPSRRMMAQALVERCAGIEGGCRHVREHNKNTATMQPIPVSGELHVQRLSIEGGGGSDP